MSLLRFIILFTLLLFSSTHSYGQKTILIPPCLKLVVPNEDWNLVSHNASQAIWLNDEKKIEGNGGMVELGIRCFHRENAPYGSIEFYDQYLTSEIQNDSVTCYDFEGYKVRYISAYTENIAFSAIKQTADEYIIQIYAEFRSSNLMSAKTSFEDILTQSSVLSLQEMDREFGYPLNESEDNSEFIKRRKAALCEFYNDAYGLDWTISDMDTIPLQEIVPELYDGFSFERLFGTWNEILSSNIEMNEYFDFLFLDAESQNMLLFLRYVQEQTGELYGMDRAILRKQWETDLDKNKYFNDACPWPESFEVCNDSGELTSVWMAYGDSTESSFVVLCFHQDGNVLSSDSQWKIEWIGKREYIIDDRRDYAFWLTENSDNKPYCSNGTSNLIGLRSSDADGCLTTYIGYANNAKTSIIPLKFYQPTNGEIHYKIYGFNNTDGRVNRPIYGEYANISDSLYYDVSFSNSLWEKFDELTKLNRSEVQSVIDSLFVESYRGNHSSETIENDQIQRPYLYATNSLVFNLPPEKRVYSTDIIHKDLNGDGRMDAYVFSVSKGKIVDAQIVYDMDGDAEAEPNVEKYFDQFMISDEGRLMSRVSLEEKNLLHFFEYFDGDIYDD